MNFAIRYKNLQEAFNSCVDTVKKNNPFELLKTDLPYAYPCDNYMDSILSNVLVRKSLKNVISNFYGNQVDEIKSKGIKVSETSFPKLNDIIHECCETLSIKAMPEVIVSSKLKGINALSVEHDEHLLIILSRKSTVCLSEVEMKFMIGHELGHIAMGNLICHTIKGLLDSLNNKSNILGPIVSDIIDVPLNKWYQCSEFTADRAGLICCKNTHTAIGLFNKLGMHTPKEENCLIDFLELKQSHPLIKNRIKEIEKFNYSNFPV